MDTVMGTTSGSNIIDVDVYARGENGRGVTSTIIEYQASDNCTTVPTGTWSSSFITPTQGQYLWTRTTFNYNDESSSVSYNVSYFAIDGEKGDTGAYYSPQITTSPSDGSIYLTWIPNDPTLPEVAAGNIKGEAGSVKFSYVQSLPTTNIDPSTFYIMDATSPTSYKYYDEYFYINNHWEKIGEDLSAYYNSTTIDSMFRDFVSTLINIEEHDDDTTYYLTGVEEIDSANNDVSRQLCQSGITYYKATGENKGTATVDGSIITTNLFYSIG